MTLSEKEKNEREIKIISQNNFYEELPADTPRNLLPKSSESQKIIQIKSTITYLKENKKISDDFIVMFSTLSFEEIIYLKLELVSNIVKNRLFGFALIRTLIKLSTEVVESYAFTHFRTNRDVANFVGISNDKLSDKKVERNKRKRNVKEYCV